MFFFVINMDSYTNLKSHFRFPCKDGSTDNRALVGGWARWAMAHPLFENLVIKGALFKTFSKNFTSSGPPTFKMPTRVLTDLVPILNGQKIGKLL